MSQLIVSCIQWIYHPFDEQGTRIFAGNGDQWNYRLSCAERDNALNSTALSDLAATAAALSDRYREERHDIKPRVISDREALAYLAVRLPATYAAIRSSFNAVAEDRPDFMPGNALEVGAGPGTALWAAAECWPAVSEALLVEASPIFRTYGERLAAEAELPHVTWRVADIAVDAIDSKPRDLVTMAYVLNELRRKLGIRFCNSSGS